MNRLIRYAVLVGIGFGAYHFTIGSGQSQGRIWFGQLNDLVQGASQSPCKDQDALQRLSNRAQSTLGLSGLTFSSPKEVSSQGNVFDCSVVLADQFLVSYSVQMQTGASGLENAQITDIRIQPVAN